MKDQLGETDLEGASEASLNFSPSLFPGFPRARITTSPASMAAADDIARTSRRRIDTPVRRTFVRARGERIPPLAMLHDSGGRGNSVAIKLYLALIWRCSAPPYETSKPARSWATLLDLPSPETLGARRVTGAFKTLEGLKLIKSEARPGEPSVVQLLDEGGTGRAYDIPSSSYSAAQARKVPRERLERDLYFKVTTRLWQQGILQSLSGSGLVMLLVLLAEQAGRGESVWISPPEFNERYRVSHKTRTVGTKELKDLGLIRITRSALAESPGASVFDRVRYRNVYRLAPIAQDMPAEPAAPQLSPSDTAGSNAARPL